MAAFIAKQVVGDKLSSVKGAIGGDKEEGDKDADDSEAAEIEEARQEMEEKRKEKHRKMEEERETMRQGIRDKYGLKKKEEIIEEPEPMSDGRVGRKKKTPAELAAEAQNEEEEEDEFGGFPTNFSDLSTKMGELPAKFAQGVGEVSQKCVLQ